jgi:hypothetical protein
MKVWFKLVFDSYYFFTRSKVFSKKYSSHKVSKSKVIYFFLFQIEKSKSISNNIYSSKVKVKVIKLFWKK